MKIFFNPTDERIAEIIDESSEKAAKWIRCKESGTTYYWAAEKATHATVARATACEDYEKGIAIQSE